MPPLSLFGGGEKRRQNHKVGGGKRPQSDKMGAKSAPTYNKQRVQGKSPLLEQHLGGD